jgi:outer membrane immunogenic protein
LVQRRNPRLTKTFETEAEARDFARAKFEGGLIVTAGTINPHLPRRAIPSEETPAWLESGQTPEPTDREDACWGIVPVGAGVIPDGCADRSGGLVGGQLGYRWQSNQFVFGLEAQGDWADISGSRVSILFSTRVRIDGLGLFTGQIGYAWNAALLYVKGGAAVTSNRFDVLTTLGGVNVASASSTRWGGTVGVGFEYGFAPNWSAGLEYDHLFMGDSNNSFSVANPLLAGALNRISQDVDMVTVRVNYRFGGPVVAKY